MCKKKSLGHNPISQFSGQEGLFDFIPDLYRSDRGSGGMKRRAVRNGLSGSRKGSADSRIFDSSTASAVGPHPDAHGSRITDNRPGDYIEKSVNGSEKPGRDKRYIAPDRNGQRGGENGKNFEVREKRLSAKKRNITAGRSGRTCGKNTHGIEKGPNGKKKKKAGGKKIVSYYIEEEIALSIRKLAVQMNMSYSAVASRAFIDHLAKTGSKD